MAIESHITVNMICDKCSKELEHVEYDEISVNAAEEKTAEVFGWRIDGTEVICPDCQEDSGEEDE